MDNKEQIIAECKLLMNSVGNIPFDEALPTIQKELWKIADKYGTTGPEVLGFYMDQLAKEKKE